MFENKTIAFIGSGQMAEAMIAGLVSKNIIPAGQIIAAGPRHERGQELTARYGVRNTVHNLHAMEQANILVLSVKPQFMEEVLSDGKTHLPHCDLILSIAAGVSLHYLRACSGNPRIVRAMPNTPAKIGRGITVWISTPEVESRQLQQAKTVLQAFGDEVHVDKEQYLDMATALSGTGPAYIFLVLEAMIDAGVHLGLSRRVSEQLVLKTMLGSVEYAMASSDHLATLRNQVTSPGGTSAEAIYQLEKGGLRTVLSDAIWAAYHRSVALGKTHRPSTSGESD